MKKMLLLGDSINLHYGSYLAEYLKNNFEIHSKPGKKEALKKIDYAVGGNGGDSSMVLEYVKERDKNNDLDFDVFVFNCGLHDIKRKVPEEKLQIPIEQYEQNLNEIYKIMQKNGVKCIFITTTPVYEEMHLELAPAGIKRYNADVCAYNEVAVKTAEKNNAPIIDLYGFVCAQNDRGYLDYAHFNLEARKLQAAFIAGSVLCLM